MAPPPEYDKEPKAPDKSVTSNSTEDSKLVYNHIKDQSANSEHKTTTTVGNVDVEFNKHVETLDDGQLRALLDEAITYKCPKDREGKSSLFKELLEEVEQDEQACEAAARLGAGRNSRRARARREHHSSLQDLVAAMAGEAAPRRGRAHAHSHAPAPHAGTVSARALHGGSLPSGVDTSSMLGEETVAGASRGGYLATVRCVNPPPLAERRVSTGDANPPPAQPPPPQPAQELDVLTRRSKPMFPMTYTARATLEIGSGSVCSGRAVTTTTASNQVRTASPDPRTPVTPRAASQAKLMSALCVPAGAARAGGGAPRRQQARDERGRGTGEPRGPTSATSHQHRNTNRKPKPKRRTEDPLNAMWVDTVNNWYEGLESYSGRATTKGGSSSMDNFVKEYSVAGTNTNLSLDSDIKIFHNNIQNILPKLPTDPPSANFAVVRDIDMFKINKCDDYKSLRFNDPKDYIDKLNCDNTEDNEDVQSDNESDIISRRQYRQRVGYNLVPPSKITDGPRNCRRLTIGKPPPCATQTSKDIKPLDEFYGNSKNHKLLKVNNENKISHIATIELKNSENAKNYEQLSEVNKLNEKFMFMNSVEVKNLKDDSEAAKTENRILTTDITENDNSINLVTVQKSELENRSKLMPSVIEKQSSLEISQTDNNILSVEVIKKSNLDESSKTKSDYELVDIPFNCKSINDSDSFVEYVAHQKKLIKQLEINNNEDNRSNHSTSKNIDRRLSKLCTEAAPEGANEKKIEINESPKTLTQATTLKSTNILSEVVFDELQNNAYILLTLPKSFVAYPYTKNEPSPKVTEISDANSTKAAIDCKENKPVKKNKKKPKQQKASVSANKEGMNKKALKMLLYSDSPAKTDYIKKKFSPSKDKEVDSAIPFSCITTPEVVASCNTTSSTSQSAVAVDPKPLQLVSSYRAVACLMDGVCPPRAPSPPPHAPRAAPLAAPAPHQPRAVSSSFNGLPLSRPAADEYKVPILTVHYRLQKSLDENGNAVQGFGSPLAGSAQHKKPRRKKSSKNETVIKSHQIDGYQGNKDLNEVLRFIESNAESARAPKLRKHKDDSDDKGKKRSAERRKDKDKPQRASSLEELSRTTLEDLTDEPAPRQAPAKPERRSWGDDARALLEPDAPPDAADFQTVTKKRRPRRRADERAPSPPRRRASPPAPFAARAPASAPASERSNDSNDDTDCAHSPPPPPPAPQAPPPPPAACVSYADIARTRHNIPDLIESCNFYGEGDERERERPPAPAAAAPDDADQYPALAARRGGARDKPASPPRARKEPAAPPAPDVVADRRPPVVLLAAGARRSPLGDMDGVTFGFDVNEQLLGARCDLLEHGAVAVRAGCAALRYVPPPPPQPPHAAAAAMLHQIVDYVGTAWEDVVRGGKVRYFSECATRSN